MSINLKHTQLLTIIDLSIVCLCFSFFSFLKPYSFYQYLIFYKEAFAGFILIWLFESLIFKKFYFKNPFKQTLSKLIAINSYILFTILFLIYVFDRFHYSRLIVLGTICLTTILEVTFFSIIKTLANDDQIEVEGTTTNKEDLIPAAKINLEIDFNLLDAEYSLKNNLQRRYLAKQPEIFEFVNNSLPLSKIHKSMSLVLDTNTFFNFENTEANSQHLFMNLHKINDYRHLNKYFMQINSNLQFGGFFIGWGQTIAEKYHYYHEMYPRLLAIFLYTNNFIQHRVLPKLPIIKKIYFAITKGKNRAISKAEILGRLAFCGFKIIAIKEIDYRLYYITQKIDLPNQDDHPSYGPIMKMNRYGKDGKLFRVYKVRSMHPYSEYLQHYLVENHGYSESGKISDDFRVTGWAKILRKLWLDELPQLINVLKGEMVLVGVRPLSKRFLDEYPEDLKKERFKYKPGCIPPYVALRMQALEEYIESERIYLAAKKKHPIWTDIRFFFWAVFNILTKRIQSG
jgi:lipopolysaccharide/colanic/teichoic acid biosynthesis glycosyltransferase